MEQRPIFVPMDFEYDNKLGSVDAKSPFLTNQMNRSTGQRGFSSTSEYPNRRYSAMFRYIIRVADISL